MRKNINTVKIEGYVYDSSKLTLKETGPQSKNPGTPFISGELDVAVDEDGLNVISVHFTYMTEHYMRSGKVNSNYSVLSDIINNPQSTWLAAGKENALKVRVTGALALNDFISKDGEAVAAKRVEGSFISVIPTLCEERERNTFQLDMVMTNARRVEADPERNIDNDYVVLKGAAFNFRNDLLPVELTVRNSEGMEYFENLDLSNSEPCYTKVWGRVVSQTIKTVRSEESAFGDSAVRTIERRNREWVVTGTAKYPYDFGDEDVLTEKELIEAMQNREVYLADVKKRHDDYLNSTKESELKTEQKTLATNKIKRTKFEF